ncbi:hypothetical protein [Cohnella silvisoli]|uniref:Uncharacterized protein n=1 Tax=Cohnella silvisoli TaxID=2873699 RepID=A0ABV1KTG6_9BACL|nr:hypothetical protein [Cohnella silvisoli]MCD9021523.1 hypothetical protein [Cohnella silvisoli]
MIGLILLYVLFLIGGISLLRKNNSNNKEKALFIGITTIGAALWGSIIVRHPLDLNKTIAWIFIYWQ